nr:unnamed protein product [Callosobruchus analis]
MVVPYSFMTDIEWWLENLPNCKKEFSSIALFASRLKKRGISLTNIMIVSITASTLKQYEGGLKRWWSSVANKLFELKTIYPDETISLEKLVKKTVTLLALITAHRVQTVSLIPTDWNYELQLIDYNPAHIFHISWKTEVSTTPEAYIERTSQYREGLNSKFFLTYKKPRKEVTSQSISRRIKSVLLESCIDTSIFSAQSTRHAYTSAARCKRLNLDLIRRTAGWTKQSMTFAKFYDRPLN